VIAQLVPSRRAARPAAATATQAPPGSSRAEARLAPRAARAAASFCRRRRWAVGLAVPADVAISAGVGACSPPATGAPAAPGSEDTPACMPGIRRRRTPAPRNQWKSRIHHAGVEIRGDLHVRRACGATGLADAAKQPARTATQAGSCRAVWMSRQNCNEREQPSERSGTRL